MLRLLVVGEGVCLEPGHEVVEERLVHIPGQRRAVLGEHHLFHTLVFRMNSLTRHQTLTTRAVRRRRVACAACLFGTCGNDDHNTLDTRRTSAYRVVGERLVHIEEPCLVNTTCTTHSYLTQYKY